MSPREEFATALRAAVGDVSVRTLANRVGWARSTIQDWLKGTRVPSADRLEDLLGAIGCSPETRTLLFTLREEAQTPASRQIEPDLTAPIEEGAGTRVVEDNQEPNPLITLDGSEATPGAHDLKRSRRRLLLIGAGIGVAVALFGAGVLAGRASQSDSGATTRTVAVEARVANTEGLGVYSYQGPSNKTAKVSSLADGDLVGVVCVVVSTPVTDDTMKLTRSVWALLTTGSWVPDMYLDVDRSWMPPQPPPPPLRSC